ncbi:HAD family hydrolase [Streptomyces californicus]|uniref:HAD family hydrolase n=1 Tax=Streptomyces californicus TaxID=67351 RepID=UPI003794B811
MKLHVFDMDGTVLRGTATSLEIGRRLGCLPETVELEAAIATGRISAHSLSIAFCELWSELTQDAVDEIFAEAPWITGLREVLHDIQTRGEWAIVVTLSPSFFAENLLSFGANKVVAALYPDLPFTTAPDPAGILSPPDKITAVDQALADLCLTREQCVAYGDSGSDIPLFTEFTNTVAVNASQHLRSLARFSYNGTDLHGAYELGRRALEVPATPTS